MRDGVNFGLTSGTAELTTELRGLPLPLSVSHVHGWPTRRLAFCSVRFPPEMPRFVKKMALSSVSKSLSALIGLTVITLVT